MNITTPYCTVKTDHQSITTIILNRPEKHNALNNKLIQELNEILHQIHNSEAIKVVIFSANGKNFCSGADLTELQSNAKQQALSAQSNPVEYNQKIAQLMYRLYTLKQPTIAVVHGKVYGGGIGLVACCDCAIAGKETFFCFSELTLAFTPTIIADYIMRAIGPRAAQYHFLLAQPFNAETALQLGLVHRIVGYSKLLATAQEHAAVLQKYDTNAMTEIKQITRKFWQTGLTEQRIQQQAQQSTQRQSMPAAQAALGRFLQPS